MKIDRAFNLSELRSLLMDLINDPHLPMTNRILLYRFLDKITDSDKFSLRVNKEFSALNLKMDKNRINDSIVNRNPINLNCDFYLKPVQTTNWELHWNNRLFLSKLDAKIARRIAFDINAAFAIKASRLDRGIED